MACACKNNSVITPPVPVNYINNNLNCEYTLQFLQGLLLNIENFIRSGILLPDDFNILQIYRGQVLSGINLNNYCYTNYNNVNTLVNNVISKY